MKKTIQIFVFLLASFITLGEKSFAQNEEPPLLVCSFQRVLNPDVATVNNMIKETFAPILNKLVDEKMLLSWGQFNHAWGDEWNINVWYVVPDMVSFDKFWNEYIKRVTAKDEKAFQNLTKFVQMHKDNIYTIEYQYPVPPQN
jgi:hypothetical protein